VTGVVWGRMGDGKLRWVQTTQGRSCKVQNDLGWKLCGVGEAFIALTPPTCSPSQARLDSFLIAQSPGH
jgi:hypothetical protein